MLEEVIEVINGKEPSARKDTKTILNNEFQKGKKAHELLENIRSLKKPIIVDLNGVLINNQPPHVSNPEAGAFLKNLRKVGDVVIVTAATNWDEIKKILEDNSLWSDDIVLMVRGNWDFMSGYRNSPSGKKDSIAETLISEFIQRRKDCPDLDYFNEDALINKRIAPIFDKNFDIPIIDDTADAVRHNPGMFGVIVSSFAPESAITTSAGRKMPSLSDALQKVRKYYDALSK